MNRRALPVIGVVAVIGLGLDLLIRYSPVVGYGAGIGLFGTIILTLVAKKVMAPALQRPEDHYPDDQTPDVEYDVYGVRSDGHSSHGQAGDDTGAAASTTAPANLPDTDGDTHGGAA